MRAAPSLEGRAPLTVLVAMSVTAASVLTLQISITRLLSATVSYHAVFLVIAVVMLGLAASSVRAFVDRQREPAPTCERAAWAAALAGAVTASGLAGFLALGAMATQLVFQVLIIVVGTGAFFFSFYFAGYVVAFLLSEYAGDISRVYWVDLTGAAAGCLVAIALLNLVSAQAAILACGVAFGAVGFLLARRFGAERTRTWAAALLGVAALGLVVSVAVPSVTRIRYAKLQSQSGVVWERWNTLARVSVTRDVPGIGEARLLLQRMEHVTPEEMDRLTRLWQGGWGMSRAFDGEVPETLWIQLDSGAGTQIIEGGTDADTGFLEWDVTAAAHHLCRDRLADVFVVGGGGGRDVLTALHFGAERVDVAEINPDVVRAVDDELGDFSHRLYAEPRVHLEIGDARGILGRSPRRYDLIQMSMIDTWAASMAGSLTLTENTLYTAEAFQVFVDHLNDTGLLSISRWYDADNYGEAARLIRMMGDALTRRGVSRPADHILVFYSQGFMAGDVMTCVLKPTPLDADEIEAAREVATSKGWFVLWPPQPESPATSLPIEGLLGGDPDTLSRIPFDVSVTTDERPFFFNTRRPFSSWADAIRSGDSTRGSRASGLLLITLGMLLMVSFLFLWRPLREHHARAPLGESVLGRVGPPLAYFCGIGVAFLMIELALIQRFSVFLGHPTHALSTVLFVLLLAGGAGSFTSDRLTPPRATRAVIAALLVGLLLAAFALPPILVALYAWPVFARVVVAAAVIAPLAFAMGMIFPLGVRLLRQAGLGALIPWMWAANGFAGVLATVAAMLIATSASYTWVIVAGAVCYAVTLGSVARSDWSPAAPA